MTTAGSSPATPLGRAPAGAPAIELTSIGVRFDIPTERIVSFKEYVLRRLRTKIDKRLLWALSDVDLAVQPGEVLGVVGRNGAGKSTLLKIVSRVLRPTTGRVVIRGELSPLLELGAGFHFDLTGRENVFLNASLLGHTRLQVEERLDYVIDFSELHDFIDVPIRNYSSGMLARLGFAVATLFRPDILLVDEVLAVGDAAFQVKCHDRIEQFRDLGTTIVLVSHQQSEVAEHCDRVLWLDRGRVAALGGTDDVLSKYAAGLADDEG